MKSMRFFVLIPALALGPAALQAQAAETQGTARSQAQGQSQAKTSSARIEAAMQAAARANIPVSLLESKKAEGEAKHVPNERIAAAIEARLQALIRASDAMDRANIKGSSAGELGVAADALQAGVSENALIKISRNAPSERRVVAVAVLADLVRLGNDSEPASARVNAALASSAALANLHAEVASQLRIGGLTSTLDATGIVRIK